MCSIIQSKLCGREECQVCFERSFASHERARFWSDKNELKAIEVFKSSGKKYYFNCTCGHELYMTLSNITKGSACAYCNNQQLCNNEYCESCKEKSFVNHPRAKFWSEKNDCKPRDVFKSSNKKYYFSCECGHEIYMTLSNITKGSACAYCNNQQLCNNEYCESCKEKSFVNHPRAKFWSEKNDCKPRDVFKSSNKKYYFSCECGHEIYMTLSNITKGSACAYCNNQQLCNNEYCESCKEKSFVNHPRAKFWSEKNDCKPRDVFKSSGKKYYFKCENNHEFEASLNSITGKNTWCSRCTNKTEAKLLGILEKNGYSVDCQRRFNWCRNQSNNVLPFDFVFENIKLIIELDGPQHFKQVSNWTLPEDQQKIDHYKMNKAILHGYTIIRILQEDVFDDKYDWWSELQSHLYLHPVPTRIYLCKNNEYDCYMPKKITPAELTDDDIKMIYEFLATL